MKTLKHLCIVILLLITSIETNAQIKVLTNGNVGIDETNPVSKLSIGTEGYTYAKAYIYNAGGSRALQTLQEPAAGGYCYGLVSSIKYGDVGDRLVGAYGSAYRGSTPQNFGRTYGLYGIAGNATSGFNWAVYGSLIGSNNGAAIYGVVPGYAENGVEGKFAGYFRGRVYCQYRLGVRRTNPYYEVDVDGTIRCTDLIETSDIRLKEDIRDLSSDINRIKQLRGVKFKIKKIIESQQVSDTGKIEETLILHDEQYYSKDRIGFIAQEIKELYPELVSEDEEGFLSVNYTRFIPILAEAIKEQQMIIENLESDISALKYESSGNLKSALITSDDNLSEQPDKPILYQNIPNPFNKNTDINFYLPKEINSAVIYIYNMQGTPIKNIKIDQRGNASITIQSSSLQPGMYLYSLIADGKEVDTKRMILTEN